METSFQLTEDSSPELDVVVERLRQRRRRLGRMVAVSYRFPLKLQDDLRMAARKHEINQTDIVIEAVELMIDKLLKTPAVKRAKG